MILLGYKVCWLTLLSIVLFLATKSIPWVPIWNIKKTITIEWVVWYLKFRAELRKFWSHICGPFYNIHLCVRNLEALHSILNDLKRRQLHLQLSCFFYCLPSVTTGTSCHRINCNMNVLSRRLWNWKIKEHNLNHLHRGTMFHFNSGTINQSR